MFSRIPLWFSLLTTFLLLNVSSPASAQDEMEDEEAGLDLVDLMNIEVTVASLFAEAWVDTGAAVSTIDEKGWRKLGARTVYEAIGNFQSISPLRAFGGSYNLPIRGFASTSSNLGIASQLDGIPMNTLSSASALGVITEYNLSALSRIEMIRGPGSTLYGSDAFHGVLSLRTFDATEDVVHMEAEGGNVGHMRASIRGSQELLPGLRIDATVAASAQNAQYISMNYLNSLGQKRMGRREDAWESQTAHLKANYEINDMIRAHGGAYLMRYKADNSRGYAGNVHNAEKSIAMGRAGIELKLPDEMGLDLEAYYWYAVNDTEAERAIDQRGTLASLCLDADNSRAGSRLTFKHPDFLSTQWSARYEFSYMKVDDSRNDAVPLGRCGDYQPKTKAAYDQMDRTIHSVLAQTRTSLFEDLFYVTLGLRGDFYSDFGGQFTPRGGIIFKPHKDSALKLLYARAFRAPNSNELKGFAGAILGDENLKPEIIDTFELIYAHSSENWKMTIGGFVSFWKEGIIIDTNLSDAERELLGGRGYGKYANNGDLQSRGVEAEATYNQGNWTTSFSASYIASEDVTELPEGANQPHPLATALMLQPKDDGGRPFTAFPAFIINTNVGYHFTDWDLHVDLSGRVMIDMTELSNTIAPNSEQLPPFAMLNASISKQVEDLEVQLIFRNMLDLRNATPHVISANIVDGERSQGFNGSLRVSYDF